MRWSPGLIVVVLIISALGFFGFSYVVMAQRQRVLVEMTRAEAARVEAEERRAANIPSQPSAPSPIARDSGPSLRAPAAAPLPADLNRDLAAYKRAKPDDRRKLTDAIRQKLVKQFDQAHQTQLKELKALEDRVTKIRSTLQTRANERDKIVDLRLTQLLREAEGLGWSPPTVSPTPGSTLSRSPVASRYDLLNPLTPSPSSDYETPAPPTPTPFPAPSPSPKPAPGSGSPASNYTTPAPTPLEAPPMPSVPIRAPAQPSALTPADVEEIASPSPGLPTSNAALPGDTLPPPAIAAPVPVDSPAPVSAPVPVDALTPASAPALRFTTPGDGGPLIAALPNPINAPSDPNSARNVAAGPATPTQADLIENAVSQVSRYQKAREQDSKHADDYRRQAFDAVNRILNSGPRASMPPRDVVGVVFRCFDDEPCAEELDQWASYFQKNDDPFGRSKESREALFSALSLYKLHPEHEKKRCLPESPEDALDLDEGLEPGPRSRRVPRNDELQDEPRAVPSRSAEPVRGEPPSTPTLPDGIREAPRPETVAPKSASDPTEKPKTIPVPENDSQPSAPVRP